MSDVTRAHLEDHAALAVAVAELLPILDEIGRRVCESFAAGGRLYAFGNGGSAADAQHLAGELIGRYKRTRRPLPAISLAVDPSVVTCIANDFGYDELFARQVEGLARPGDIVVGFTTSGRSPTVVRGLEAGRAAGATTVLLSAGDGGPAATHADLALLVPSESTARIQEMHLTLLHLLSEIVDRWAAGESEPTSGESRSVSGRTGPPEPGDART